MSNINQTKDRGRVMEAYRCKILILYREWHNII